MDVMKLAERHGATRVEKAMRSILNRCMINPGLENIGRLRKRTDPSRFK